MDEDDDLEVVDKPFTVTKIQRTTSLHNVDVSHKIWFQPRSIAYQSRILKVKIVRVNVRIVFAQPKATLNTSLTCLKTIDET